ncbi:MAG: STAS domain-containing protein [Candidatus Hydrogenedentes bacterium]|nr:STAS domain-containing protein [Candidatus Hydrogenedentota bacterium]
MEISKSNEDGVLVVSLAGRLDEMATREVEAAFTEIVERGAAPVILDLGGVEYISSNGLRVLLLFNRGLSRVAGQLKLAGLTPFVAEVFQISNFTAVFEIYPTRQLALAAVQERGGS